MDLTKVLRKGTKVIITKDIRKQGAATGKTATFTGIKGYGWLLFCADGSPESEYHELPQDYVEWKFQDGQKFPGAKCGVRLPLCHFQLDDGSTVTGLECYWIPESRRVRDRIMEPGLRFYDSLFKSAKAKK